MEKIVIPSYAPNNIATFKRFVIATVQDRFFTVEFVKADGTRRTMNGRLGVKSRLKGGKNCNDTDRYLTMWVPAKKGYRNVNLHTIKSVTVDHIRHEYV